jgi:hypothetical protein
MHEPGDQFERSQRQEATGPTTGTPPKPVPPAIVSTLTNRWSLGTDAVAATVLDLATRGHVSIRAADDQVMVHVRGDGHRVPTAEADDNTLTEYEKMVLRQLHRRARQTGEDWVLADALAHSTDGSAREWWRSFRDEAYRDAVVRGLARRRWPVGPLRLESTEAGQDAAARWLRLRSSLAADPSLTNAGPDDAPALGPRLAYAAAMGLAAPATAPFASLTAGSRREIWSATSGRWRRVRVRYPWLAILGFGGINPVHAVAVGMSLSVVLLLGMLAASTTEDSVPGLVAMALAACLLPFFLTPLLEGRLRSLHRFRFVQEGRVLQVDRYDPDKGRSVWHVVVDDGLSDVLWPWSLHREPGCQVNDYVRAEMSLLRDRVRRVHVIDDTTVSA